MSIRQTHPTLRMIREARGLSLRQAAQLARIDAAQLSRIERGKGGMTVGSLLRLCRVIGLSDLARRIAPLVERPDGRLRR